jgi:hypothetical protein
MVQIQNGTYPGMDRRIQERRNGYCAVHDFKCAQWAETEKTLKAKVPIWVFVIFISLAAGGFSYLNLNIVSESKETQQLLKEHIDSANRNLEKVTRVLAAVSHSNKEVSLNQRTVMRKLELPFQNVPNYDGPMR